MNDHLPESIRAALAPFAPKPDDYAEMQARRRLMKLMHAQHCAKHPDVVEPPIEREVQNIGGFRVEARVER